MQRRAFIIGSPLSKNSSGHLRGVEKDVNNVYRLLRSSVGGAFEDSEITYFKNPRVSQLNLIQRLANDADLAVVYYSGHGGMYKNEDYLQINSREIVNVKHLFTNAKRQQFFIDACRNDYEWEHFVGIGDVGYCFDTSERSLARKLFNAHLQNAPLGGTITFSSKPNQSSNDTEDGGMYTLSLLDAVSNWHDSQKNSMLTIRQAFEKTAKKLRERDSLQSPRLYYLGNKSAFDMPFVVNAIAYKNQQKLIQYKNPNHQNQYSRNLPSGLGVLAGLALTGLIVDGLFSE